VRGGFTVERGSGGEAGNCRPLFTATSPDVGGDFGALLAGGDPPILGISCLEWLKLIILRHFRYFRPQKRRFGSKNAVLDCGNDKTGAFLTFSTAKTSKWEHF
jgi:hypothetical protein